MSAFRPRAFGSTNVTVSPLGLGSSYGLSGREVERAFEHGVSFFLWGSIRKSSFAKGLNVLAKRHREKMFIAIQTYTRAGSLMEWSVDRALQKLGTDYVDVATLSWWNGAIPQRIIDAGLFLREKGKVRHLMVSGHNRPNFERFIDEPAIDALMLRYNAAHPGAEREIFPHLARRRPGVLSFTATRWGTLLDPKYTPDGEDTPRASDCYRFALSNPNVDVTLSGPKNGAELDEALAAIERGPMSEEELAWMRRVGAVVRERTATRRRFSVIDIADRLASFSLCAPKQLAAGSR